MRFRTDLDLAPANIKIGHNDPIALMGSCFSSTIGEKLIRYKFQALVNPYGVLYHPYAILNNLKASIDKSPLDDNDIVKVEDHFAHYAFHSSIRAASADELKELIIRRHDQVGEIISNASCLFFTLGSAFHFYHVQNQSIVANCHKQPGNLFERRLSSVETIKSNLIELVQVVREINKTANIILTVSPVRHIRDGLIANNRSKAHLLAAVHDIVDHDDQVHYFPAYELLLDDLRDYRFYAGDLIHPNNQAIQYIWDQFERCYLKETTLLLNRRIEKIQNAFNHRPFNPQSASHKEFIKKIIRDMEDLSSQYNLDFSSELKQMQEKLQNE